LQTKALARRPRVVEKRLGDVNALNLCCLQVRREEEDDGGERRRMMEEEEEERRRRRRREGRVSRTKP
jgi:hypothetical protein